MKKLIFAASCLFVLLLVVKTGQAIQCYQCDSNEDAACPATQPFDLNLNAVVDCYSFEADIYGTFCMKITQQSPGWHAWKKITRRCGSRSDTGVAWGCNWEFEENGVWKETCYCSDKDGCNGAETVSKNTAVLAITVLTTALYILFVN